MIKRLDFWKWLKKFNKQKRKEIEDLVEFGGSFLEKRVSLKEFCNAKEFKDIAIMAIGYFIIAYTFMIILTIASIFENGIIGRFLIDDIYFWILYYSASVAVLIYTLYIRKIKELAKKLKKDYLVEKMKII